MFYIMGGLFVFYVVIIIDIFGFGGIEGLKRDMKIIL